MENAIWCLYATFLGSSAGLLKKNNSGTSMRSSKELFNLLDSFEMSSDYGIKLLTR